MIFRSATGTTICLLSVWLLLLLTCYNSYKYPITAVVSAFAPHPPLLPRWYPSHSSAFAAGTVSFVAPPSPPSTSTFALFAKKRGKRLERELQEFSSSSPPSSSSTTTSSARSSNESVETNVRWTPLPLTTTLLPPTPPTDKIVLLETDLPELIRPATNPRGAVAVVTHDRRTYHCFEANCPSCKVPLTQAQVVSVIANDHDDIKSNRPTKSTANAPTSTPPSLQLSCSFCSATYDLNSGARVASFSSSSSTQAPKGGGGGFFQGLVSNVLAADPRNAGPLRIYPIRRRRRSATPKTSEWEIAIPQ